MMMRTIRDSFGVWQLRSGLLLALFLLALPLPASAATQEFTVVASGVDRMSLKALEFAKEYARRRAVYLATYKLGVADAQGVAAKISPTDLNQIVRGITVLETRREGETTYAKISVTIVDEPLQRLLAIQNVATTIADDADSGAVRTVFVLPALVTPDKTWIWEKENILRRPLSTELLQQAHGSVILPSGDLQDLRLLDAANITKVTAQELKPMFDRYGADEIIIALVTLGAEHTNDPTQVILRRLSPMNPRDELLTIQPLNKEELADSRLARAAHAVARAAVQIATSTTADQRKLLAAAKKINVLFDYAIPLELGRMTQAIRQAPGVVSLEMPTITLNDTSGVIYYKGEQAALRQMLAGKGVIILEGKDGWTLSMR